MIVALGLLAVLALILANGYFVAAEFAYVAARRAKLEELAGQGNRRAHRALGVIRRLSFVLSGAQLGITVTSLVVGYIAEATLGRALRPLIELLGVSEQASFGVSVTVAFFLATVALMVLGELGPKNLAIARPEPLAIALAGSYALFMRVAGPLVRVFDGASNRLLRSLGIEPVEELSAGASPEELTYIFREARREGTLTDEQTALLGRALEFGTLRAINAMVARPHIVTVPLDASCEDLRALAVASGHSRFPLIGEGLDDVRGVVIARDVLRVPAPDRARTPALSLAAQPLVVPESAPLNQLLVDLREAHVQLALVVDEYGGTSGIVTLEDIVEELVGSIEDEYDEEAPGVELRPGGARVIPGSWRVDEAEREAGVPLPYGEYETVSGLVMAHLGRVPRPGDIVALEHATLRVEDLDGLAVGRVRVELRPGVSAPGVAALSENGAAPPATIYTAHAVAAERAAPGVAAPNGARPGGTETEGAVGEGAVAGGADDADGGPA